MHPLLRIFDHHCFKFFNVVLTIFLHQLSLFSQTPTYSEGFDGATPDLEQAPWTMAGWATTVAGTNMGTGTATIIDDPTEPGNRVMKVDKRVPPPGENYDVNSSREEIKYLSKASNIPGAPSAFPQWFTPITYRWRFYFTDDHDWDAPENGNFGIASWHHSTQVGISGGAPANLRVVGNDLQFKVRWASPDNPTDNDVKESNYIVWSDLKKNTWYYIVIDMTWDYREGQTGQVKAYIKEDDWPSSTDLVLDHSGPGTATGYNWDLTNWPQVGLYAWRWRNPLGVDQSREAGVEKFELLVDDWQYTEGQHFFSDNVNKAPVADAGASKSITLPINTVTLNGSGSDPNGSVVSYQWVQISGPATATLSETNTTDPVVSSLVEGNYVFELRVTDDEGATDSDRMFVEVEAPTNQSPQAHAGTDLTIVRPANSARLNGTATDQDGSVQSYQWTQKKGPNTATLVGADSPSMEARDLVEGSYVFELTVTDDLGAIDIDQVTVNLFEEMPTVTASIIDATCDALNGAITLDLNGAQGSYSFQWSTGATNRNLVGISAGNYKVTITDQNGASFHESYTVPSLQSNLIINAEIDHTSCSAATGAIQVTASGGVAPYRFNWSNGKNTANINQLSGGTYHLTVVDQNGCHQEVTYKVPIEPGETVFELNSEVTNSSCTGNDGTISIKMDGAQGPYSFLWANGATTPNLTGLGIGGYQVKISDRHGCFMNKIFIVDQNSISNPVITRSGDSLITEQPATYYQWYKDRVVLEGATQNFLKITKPGSYMVQIADENCSNISEPFVVQEATAFANSDDYIFEQVEIYPNPVENQLTARIFINESTHTRITIVDFQGNPVLTQDLGKVASAYISTLNLSSLPAGLYFIKITAGQEVVSRKFVKR
jgi:hypothetical protein